MDDRELDQRLRNIEDNIIQINEILKKIFYDENKENKEKENNKKTENEEIKIKEKLDNNNLDEENDFPKI